MTQADFTIANQTFPNTRTELNTSLQALATNSAGNSAPSTTFPNQWHFDSDGNILYMRNKDNDAWVSILTIGATSDDVQSLFTNVIAEGTSATGVTVDGVLLKDGGFTATLGSTITTADNTDTLTLTSTDNDAVAGPNLRFYRNRANPADDDVIGRIDFEGRNNNSQDVIYANIQSEIMQEADGSEDGQLQFGIMKTGTLRNAFMIDRGEVAINEDGQDIDTRIESSGNANMLFVDGGNNRVGIANNDPAFDLDVRKATSTTMRVGPTGTSGDLDGTIIINNGGSGDAMLRFDYEGNADRARIGVTTSGQTLQFFTAGSNERFRIASNLSSGAEAAPDVASGGLCLQLNANDNAVLTFKSTDVNAGANVSGLESDTFVAYKKLSNSAGGLLTTVQSGTIDCIETRALQAEGTANTAKSTSANAPIMFKSAETHSGEGLRALSNSATNANLFIIADHTTRRFIFDSEGDLHSDSSNTTFDSYEDAHLVRAFDLSHGRGVINSKFDEFIKYQHEDLAEAGLVGREEDGTPNHFINMSGFQRLHNGAIWQQYEKTERLTQAMYELAKAAVGEEKANEILEQNEIKLLN